MPYDQTPRESHIVRIYQDNNPDSDVWVDIERLDRMTIVAPQAENCGLQEYKWEFDWDSFDPDSSAAEYKDLVDPNDKNNKIRIPLKRTMFIYGQQQGYRYTLNNSKNNDVRRTHTNKIVHRDVPDSAMEDRTGRAEIVFGKQPPYDAQAYKDLIKNAEKDEDQYIKVEVIDKFVLRQNRGQDYSKKNWYQNVDAILSESL